MSKIAGLHVDLAPFEVHGGCLYVGGKSVVEIMSTIESVPAYLYDANLIRERICALNDALPDAVSLHYAIKANPMPEVVNLIANLVGGLDIASGGELQVALNSGCDPAAMSFAGPGKKNWELKAAIDAGVTINVESQNELERIAELSTDASAKIALRVNPDFELKSSGMRMSGGPKPFGIDSEMIPGTLKRVAELPVHFRGFHIFSGAQNLNPASICESQEKAFALALNLSQHAPTPPQFINVGGGFGIPYFPGDKRLDISTICANLQSLSAQLCSHYPQCELIIELGRYLVGEAGVYVSRIVDKKQSRGHTFLVTDGGLHHHLSATGNFGQVIRKNYPVVIANKIGCTDTQIASIVGPLCTPLDLLASNMELANADIGDLVAIFQSGAYGFTASPHLFLSHPAPAQLLL